MGSKIDGFKMICFNCLEECQPATESSNIKKEYQAFLPRCTECKLKGISSFIRKNRNKYVWSNIKTEKAVIDAQMMKKSTEIENLQHDKQSNTKKGTNINHDQQELVSSTSITECKSTSTNTSKILAKSSSHASTQQTKINKTNKETTQKVETEKPEKHKYNTDINNVQKDDKYIVDKILDDKRILGKMYLLVKWRGYKRKTWELESNLREDIPLDVDKYYEQQCPKSKTTSKRLKKVGKSIDDKSTDVVASIEKWKSYYSVQQLSMVRLKPKELLNDEIIDFYLILLERYSIKNLRRKVKCHRCNFMTYLLGNKNKLKHYDYNKVKT